MMMMMMMNFELVLIRYMYGCWMLDDGYEEI